MEKKIFREKSIDRISSPEQLDEYLKVTTPSLWLVLAAVVVLLAGILVWASVGTLETTIDAVGVVDNQTMEIALSGNDANRIASGMEVRVGTNRTDIEYIQYDEVGRANAFCRCELPDGNYRLQIVVESIHPIRFLFR